MSERGQGENLKKGFMSEIDTNIIGNYLENESGNFWKNKNFTLKIYEKSKSFTPSQDKQIKTKDKMGLAYSKSTSGLSLTAKLVIPSYK